MSQGDAYPPDVRVIKSLSKAEAYQKAIKYCLDFNLPPEPFGPQTPKDKGQNPHYHLYKHHRVKEQDPATGKTVRISYIFEFPPGS